MRGNKNGGSLRGLPGEDHLIWFHFSNWLHFCGNIFSIGFHFMSMLCWMLVGEYEKAHRELSQTDGLWGARFELGGKSNSAELKTWTRILKIPGPLEWTSFLRHNECAQCWGFEGLSVSDYHIVELNCICWSGVLTDLWWRLQKVIYCLFYF